MEVPGPRVFDKLYVYGERLTILSTENGKVAVEDEAGLRIERWANTLTWDEDRYCWRDGSGPQPAVGVASAPVSMLRCSTCGVLLDGLSDECGFCGEVIS